MTEEQQQDFLTGLADVLEVPAITPADDYRAMPLWGSLTGFALKVMLAQRFGHNLTVKELEACPTAGDLMRKVLG